MSKSSKINPFFDIFLPELCIYSSLHENEYTTRYEGPCYVIITNSLVTSFLLGPNNAVSSLIIVTLSLCFFSHGERPKQSDYVTACANRKIIVVNLLVCKATVWKIGTKLHCVIWQKTATVNIHHCENVRSHILVFKYQTGKSDLPELNSYAHSPKTDLLSVSSRLSFSYCRMTVTGDNAVSEGKEENRMKDNKRKKRDRRK